MAYVGTGSTESEYRDAMIAMRKRELDLAERRYEESKKGAFWKNFATVATVAVPLLTFFGVKEYLAARRRRRT